MTTAGIVAATATITAVVAYVLHAVNAALSSDGREFRPAKSFDAHAEEAVRLVRPASSQWMGWE